MQPQRRSLFGQLRDALSDDWLTKLRPSQRAPEGTYTIWMIQAGRGWGKTLTGSCWVRGKLLSGCSRIGLIAPTAADLRDVVIEGPSGILATAPNHDRPIYEPSKRRLTWSSGATATMYSAEEGERLRGPEHDALWCDELAAWVDDSAWSNAMFGLRIGKNPQACVTTTPRPTRLIRDLVAREGKDVVITRGSTKENEANLSPVFLSQIVGRYAGTRIGRQELDGELLEDVEGALWSRAKIEETRISRDALPGLVRIVVAIDPAAKSLAGSDETGIIVAGVDAAGGGYVLQDLSGRYTPDVWATKAVEAYERWQADRILAEVNNGGEMVGATVRSVNPAVPFKAVHASRGKATRAEPVSALYEQGKVHHVGPLPELEDQQCAFTSGFDRASAGYSPDRVDALVWALTELMVKQTVVSASDLVGRYSWG